MQRLLIVNADDYGLSPGVSEGILRAARTGIVSSTTVMANLATPDELRWLQESGLAYGCHLNLSCGRPVGDFPAGLLDDSGNFIKSKALEPDTWDSGELRRAAQEEWSAQLSLVSAAGLAPTHLDSHHHAHLLDPLFPIALDFAARDGRGLRARAAHVVRARAAGVHCPDQFIEGYFGQGHISSEALLELLAQAEAAVVELMCHPGYVDDALKARSGYVREREAELEVLADPELKSMVEAMGWRLGGYDLLAESHGVSI